MGLSAKVKEIELYRGLGRRVYRQGLAADLGAAFAALPLFLVSGGDVMLTGLYGKVTTLIGAGPTTLILNHTPTPVPPGVANAMCAVSADIAADPVNTLYFWLGPLAAQLGPTGAAALGVGNSTQSFGTVPVIVVPGTIGLVVSANAGGGVIDWFLYYIPLDTDSEVTPQ